MNSVDESELLQFQYPNNGNNDMDQNDQLFDQNPVQLNDGISTAVHKTDEIYPRIEALRYKQESFPSIFNQYQRVVDCLNNTCIMREYRNQHASAIEQLSQNRPRLEADIRQRINEINDEQRCIISLLKAVYTLFSTLIIEVNNTELEAWRRNQQLAGNGFSCDSQHLNTIQSWCDSLADIFWNNLSHCNEMKILIDSFTQFINVQNIVIVQNINELRTNFTESLLTLLNNTFIVEEQPPQVIKMNTKFTTKVSFLIGEKLNLFKSITPPKVIVSIINIKGDVSGEILNNTGPMKYDEKSGRLSIEFGNLILKKIDRLKSGKQGFVSVVDEKFSLQFSSSEFIVGGEVPHKVRTLSLPVTVIVHGSQEYLAKATITWDNAFAKPGRERFIVPDKVTWGELADALNMIFTKATGRALTNDNINCLAEKLFAVKCDDYDSMQVSWLQFCKENLSGRNFTFWEWFNTMMKILSKDQLKELWVNGLILGFVSKEKVEKMLAVCTNGTFLVRFSDSQLGGITIAWVGTVNGKQGQVQMTQPSLSKDLEYITLPNTLKDLSEMLYLYPNTPKEEAFGKYYTQTRSAASPGYVGTKMTMQLSPKSQDSNSSSNATPPVVGNEHLGSSNANDAEIFDALQAVLDSFDYDDNSGMDYDYSSTQ